MYPWRNAAARRVCTCARMAQRCCAPGVQVCADGATLLRVGRTRVRGWRNVVAHRVYACGADGATLLRAGCARVRGWRNVIAHRVCTCARMAQRCCTLCAHVRYPARAVPTTQVICVTCEMFTVQHATFNTQHSVFRNPSKSRTSRSANVLRVSRYGITGRLAGTLIGSLTRSSRR
jgi:hypothetical protein